MRPTFRLLTVLLLTIVVSAVWPARADAQRPSTRSGRPEHAEGRRRIVRRPVVRSAVFLRGGFYYPYRGLYYPYGGFYPWYGYGYGYYPWGFYPYGFYGYYNDSADVRLKVTPRDAQVYVDGYYAGVVDDYDGFFQRLRLAPGPHDIVLYHEQYRTVRESLYLSPDRGYKVTHEMVPLGPGEAAEPRPEAKTPPARRGSGEYPAGVYPPGTLPMPGAGRDSERERPAPQAEGRESRFGTLSIRVQPADAEVYIDGERWRFPDSGDRLTLQLADGPHQVEIRKEGYEPFSTDMRVRAGETATLNVSLPGRR